MELPMEILLRVFALLEPEDLERVPSVCRRWRDATGNPVWKQMFREQFGTLNITPAIVDSHEFSWHREIVARRKILKNWSFRKSKAVSFNPGIGNIDLLCPNFSTGRAITYSKLTHTSCNFEVPRALIGRMRMYGIHRGATMAVDGSPYGILYEAGHGQVQYLTGTKRGLNVTHIFEHNHNSRISSCWISKKEHPVKQRGLICVTGAVDGSVFVTSDFGNETLAHRPSSHPIMAVECSEDDGHVVVLDGVGDLYLIFNTDVTLLKQVRDEVSEISTFDLSNSSIHIGFPYVTVMCDQILYRVHLETKESAYYTFANSSGRLLSPILGFGVDGSSAQGQKYMCASFSGSYDDRVVAWPVQGEDEHGTVAPAWTITVPRAQAFAVTPVVTVAVDREGNKTVLDTLTGNILRTIAGSFSRQTLNFAPNQPVRIQLDGSDIQYPKGMISIGPAVQYFVVGNPKNDASSPGVGKKKLPKSSKNGRSHSTSEHDIGDAIASVRESQWSPVIPVSEYVIGDMYTTEEQLAYALSISQDGDDAREDDDLARALELSRLDDRPEPRGNRAGEDGTLNESHAQNQSQNQNENQEDREIEDEDLRRAIEMSLVDM